MDLWEAADIAGRTPFYLYDFAVVRQRVAQLRQALPDGTLIHYAIKANPMPALVQRIAPLVDGLDVASHAELQTALATAANREQISFAGPGKQDHELTAAVAARVVVNVESADELARLRRIENMTGRVARFALRVNPDFHLSGAGMVMGGGATQFGIDAEQVPEVLAAHGREGLVGLHVFCGSQNLRIKALQEGVTETFRLAGRLVEGLGLRLDHLNIGGGLGIPYFPGETAIDPAEYGRHLGRQMRQWRASHPQTAVVVELGRYLVGEAGVFVSKVVQRKESRGRTFLVVDGGLHHHLAASGNFGQVIRRNYPISAVTAKPTDQVETVSVVGPLCTPLDTLGRDVTLPYCEAGDLIVLHQSGAYGLTASPVNFLSHRPPAELLL
jgi:diaminopimelate decarboxylase